MGNSPDKVEVSLGKLGKTFIQVADPEKQELIKFAESNIQKGRLKIQNGRVAERLGEHDAWVREGVYVPADTSEDNQITLDDIMELADAVEAGVVEVGRYVEQPKRDVKYSVGRGVRQASIAHDLPRKIQQVEEGEIDHIQQTADSIPWVE